MKLYVDDIRPVPDESWDLARNVTDAIRALSSMRVFEVVSLDHDIQCVGDRKNGLYVDVHSSPETFEPVAHYIAAMSEDHRPKHVRIHTSNEPAAQFMEDILKHKVPLVERVFGDAIARRWKNGEKA